MHKGRVLSDLIAVDIGNSRAKLGQFHHECSNESPAGGGVHLGNDPLLPEPVATFDLLIRHDTGEFDSPRLLAWCNEHLSGTLAEWSKETNRTCPIHQLTYRDLPLPIRVDEPARVGIDRLLAALAADRLRQRDRAAIVVDLGTAITVDLVDTDGAFVGGAILPGIATSARALAEQTDALPRVTLDFLDHPPPALGKSTVPAIESGIYWGAIGAIRELVAQLSAPYSIHPDLFFTGGASQQVADLFQSQATVRHLPHLVLSGIALVNA